MDLETLKLFFFWWMIVDLALYVFTAIMVVAFPNLVVKTQTRLLHIDEVTARNTIYRYLAAFKILIIVFNFAPWIALLIIT
jgi:hypothetical protein